MTRATSPLCLPAVGQNRTECTAKKGKQKFAAKEFARVLTSLKCLMLAFSRLWFWMTFKDLNNGMSRSVTAISISDWCRSMLKRKNEMSEYYSKTRHSWFWPIHSWNGMLRSAQFGLMIQEWRFWRQRSTNECCAPTRTGFHTLMDSRRKNLDTVVQRLNMYRFCLIHVVFFERNTLS